MSRIDAAIERIRQLAVLCDDAPRYDLRDKLRREIDRDLVGLTPAEREQVEVEIRRATNT